MNALKWLIILSLPLGLILPVDSGVSFYGWPALFTVKMLLVSVGFAVLYLGVGLALEAGLGRRRPAEKNDRALRWLALILFGFCLSGTLVMALGVGAPALASYAVTAAMVGVSVWQRQQLAEEIQQLQADVRDVVHLLLSATGLVKICMVVVLSCWVVKILTLMDFVGHGDGYLYHLRFAEIWLRLGTTGTVAENILTGYGWAAEHQFLLYKVLLEGNAEQTVLARLTQFGFGILGSVCLMNTLLRSFAFPVRMVATASLLTAHFTFFNGLPKIDGIVLAGLCLAVAGIIRQQRSWWLIGCAACATLKLTGVISVVMVSAVWLLGLIGSQNIKLRLQWLIQGAVASTVAITPFFIMNYLRTANPVYPFLNSVFRSPWGPHAGDNKATVPFLSPLDGGLDTIAAVVQWHASAFPVMVAAPVFVVVALVARRGLELRQLPWGVIGSALFMMVGLSLAISPMIISAESRFFYIAVVMVLSGFMGVLVHCCETLGFSQKATVLVVTLLGLSTSRFERDVEKLVNTHGKQQLTSAFIDSEVPVRLSELVFFKKVEHQPGATVLSLVRVHNNGYFLTDGVLLNTGLSRSLMPWFNVEIPPEDGLEIARQQGADFLITSKSYMRSHPQAKKLLNQDYRVVARQGPAHYWQRRSQESKL